MLAISRLSVLLTSIVLVGCAGLRGYPPTDVGGVRPEPGDIIIEVSSSSGIPGGGSSTVRWVLRPSGECRGATDVWDVSPVLAGASPPKQTFAFRSADAYTECERLLRDSGFFWMRDREPVKPFEPSTRTIEVWSGLRHHSVRVVSPENPPDGFDKVAQFVYGLEKRAADTRK
jgi:hypothetical protein